MQRRLFSIVMAASLALGAGGAAAHRSSDAAAATTPAVAVPTQNRLAKQATEKPSLIALTPASDPTTAQTISFTTRKAVKQAYVEYWYEPDGGVVPTVLMTQPAKRRAATSKTYTGSTAPRYTASLTGLHPDTLYGYRIVTSRGKSARSTFRTADDAATDWSLLAFGDGQIDNAGVGRSVVSQALAADPSADLMLSVGDVVNNPQKIGEWRDFFTLMGSSARDRNWVISIGNHEQCVLTRCRSGNAQAFRSYFPWPRNGYPNQGQTWYYVDYQGVRIVVLDVFGAQLEEQARFLDRALAENPNKWSIVLMHASPFAGTPVRRNEAVGRLILPVIEKRNVDLVLTGHDHSYARGYLQPTGTQFAISDSGPKFYESSDEDWLAQGATRVQAASRTSTFQQISFSGNDLHYKAVVAYKGAGSDATQAVGKVLDQFVMHKNADGTRTVS